MVRGRALLLILLVLPFSLPAASASGAVGVGAEGPDAQGAFRLLFDVQRDAPASVDVSLDVRREDADGTVQGAREMGPSEFPAGTTRLNLSFLPAEGAGRYTVGLVLDGARAAEVAFVVDDAGASRTLAFDVSDELTTLTLTNDEVNADGKVKAPGDALLTRAVVSDGNGLDDVDGVTWRVEREGDAEAEGELPWPPGNGTSAEITARFDRSPFPAGNHTLRLVAHRNASELASVTRTFVIREVAPTFVSGALANVTPDEVVTQRVTLVLADKNGLPNGTLEARVYRGSTRAEGAGLSATLGAPTRGEDRDGAARVSYPLALVVPARATAGAYRVSVYHDGALVESLPFDVLPLPTLRSVQAASEGAALRFDVSGTGDGLLVARMSDGNGSAASVAARLVNGSASLRLDAPRQGAAYTWTLALHAREDGPALETRAGNWSAPLDGPALRVSPVHVRARLPAVWAVESEWSLADANATWSFTRWDGVPEPRLAGALQDGRARVDGPVDLPAGRYTARLRLTWGNGSASEATWSFDAGPWIELELGEPLVEGREARVALRNAGGVAVGRLVVESSPATDLTLLVRNETLQPAASGQRAQFASVDLAPGESAEIIVRLPEGAMRSGRHDVALRVLARVGAGS